MVLNNVHLTSSGQGTWFPASPMGAQGPVGPTGATGATGISAGMYRFSAPADGITLYLKMAVYANWRERIEGDSKNFIEIGRTLERIGIRQGDLVFGLPDPTGAWISLRFPTPEMATAFRIAVSLPVQTEVI